MLGAIFGCFGRSTAPASASPLSASPSSATPLAGDSTSRSSLATAVDDQPCVFCDVSKEKGFKILYEDDKYVCFWDRSPGSKVHLLAVPKVHVESVKTLTRDHLGLVRELAEVGTKVLEDECGVDPAHQRLGFHIPPYVLVPSSSGRPPVSLNLAHHNNPSFCSFYSIKHLHLHLLSLPLAPYSFSAIKYRPSFPSSFAPSLPAYGAVPRGDLERGGSVGRGKGKVKGISWFADVNQVIKILEKDRDVKVGSVHI
ncbi:hypothetical protein MNV49_002171 [Pseudohyphozyma bogoriensis]|nr:hypothetical protein MNV49_002171 [Pseudohyphozyma bogoriensis]